MINCTLAFMKKMLLFLFLLTTAVGQGQKIQAIEQQSFKRSADAFLGYDSLGAFYFIKDNVLYKQWDSKIWNYKNLSLGKIAKVDFQNPLKIVVFYENFNTAVLVDNQLNETLKINWNDDPTPIVAKAVGLAFGNRLWVYNSSSQQVGLYDYLKKEYQPITTPFQNTIQFFQSDFNTFFWIDDQGNAKSCDIYGKVTPFEKASKLDQFQMITKTDYLYKKDQSLYFYSSKLNKTMGIEIDKKTFENFSYKEQILSIFTNQEITNYKIKLP